MDSVGLGQDCRFCGDFFVLCRRCWRGQRYCNKSCARAAYRSRRQQAARKYSATAKGREAHRKRQQRFRIRKARAGSTAGLQESVTHPSSRTHSSPLELKKMVESENSFSIFPVRASKQLPARLELRCQQCRCEVLKIIRGCHAFRSYRVKETRK
jgi:hypothetical protein